MSLANRQTFVFLVSLLAIQEAAVINEHTTKAERVWWSRLKHQIESFPHGLIELPDGRTLNRLKVQSMAIAERMVKGHSLMELVNIWMVWAEDRLALPRLKPLKRQFYEELVANLDGLYALLDPGYKHKMEALTAIEAAKRIEREVR